MIVCACQNVTLEDIVKAIMQHGNIPSDIQHHLEIGKGCGECLETTCEEVDLPWPYAMANAEALIKTQ